MKAEKPIIMTGESVQATLDSRKTQTRRVINPDKYLQCLDPEEDREQLLAVSPWRVGDHLWVREKIDVYCVDGFYAADSVHVDGVFEWHANRPERTIPSIFMPRWASRITLEVISIRVERVRDISEADAYAEGIERLHVNHGSPVLRYMWLWDSINARRGYSWKSNPFCWVLEFRKT